MLEIDEDVFEWVFKEETESLKECHFVEHNTDSSVDEKRDDLHTRPINRWKEIKHC